VGIPRRKLPDADERRDAAVVEIVLVKASGPDEPDRTYLNRDGTTERIPVHVVHDLPHLVVESLFHIDDGLWGELARGTHREATAAATARDPKRRKLGRIVSGAASGTGTDAWLSDAHRRAKTVTNAVANRWGEGPDTPAGVRERLTEALDETGRVLIDQLDDETIALAIRGVQRLEHQWRAIPPGESLRLQWPLPRSFFDP